ncbi:signal transduction histidine kinase/CheY-like chemotaxis protein [Rhodoblastus acidophilus]|uniref:ATP-binding response regulator n=1 Tax=Rhodoblastus acidophilus TaxID=1074 RepID=UPI002223F3B9|nr:hybrid sensor histidine kinase/response regulator [Rhodoblastus acidophilus]MCW2285881.1 signal transduction histidine kinase/CheY-like chemotaxis protein [Rhodoblastus acidophilus]MCW2334818.1 signal transduction histidine kinase/CheY-like chemotaxis protein [Rhodoblastus acidophilus]
MKDDGRGLGSDGASRTSGAAIDRVRAQQIESLFKNVAPGVIGAGLACIMVEAALSQLGVLDATVGAAWFVLIAACVLAHLGLLLLYRRRPTPGRWRPWATAFTLVAFVEGCAWGWASVSVEQSQRADVHMLVVCVTLVTATAAVPAFGSYLPAALAFFLPASLPFAIASWSSKEPVIAQAAILMPNYIITLLALGLQTARIFKEHVELRLKAAELAAHLQTQIEIAEQANHAKSSFLAAASHDLRQPVHAIGMLVGALRATRLPDDAVRLTEKIETSVAALDALFGALLDISKLDAGVVEARMQNVALQPLLDRICDDLEAEARAKSIAIRRAPTSSNVSTDPILMERILRNFIANAVRHTRKGRILVGCRRIKDSVRVEIWDTGVGIAPANQDKIFDEYFQVDNSERDRQKGLGLGLAIVRRLSRLLDCPVSCRSSLGRGSCFTVVLPLARGPVPVEPAGKEPPAKSRGVIAVIDDEASIRDAMGALLTSWGYSVIVGGSGDEIIAQFSTCPLRPDLIISDYRLRNDETGIDVVARLHSEFNESIPAMLITGDTAQDRLAEAKASGLALLHKPVANSRLRAAIVRLMARPD